MEKVNNSQKNINSSFFTLTKIYFVKRQLDERELVITLLVYKTYIHYYCGATELMLFVLDGFFLDFGMDSQTSAEMVVLIQRPCKCSQ